MVPQTSGESAKVKVKVRVNVHGMFSVSSASLVEVVKSSEAEEPMETESAAKEDDVSFSVCLLLYPVPYPPFPSATRLLGFWDCPLLL